MEALGSWREVNDAMHYRSHTILRVGIRRLGPRQSHICFGYRCLWRLGDGDLFSWETAPCQETGKKQK